MFILFFTFSYTHRHRTKTHTPVESKFNVLIVSVGCIIVVIHDCTLPLLGKCSSRVTLEMSDHVSKLKFPRSFFPLAELDEPSKRVSYFCRRLQKAISCKRISGAHFVKGQKDGAITLVLSFAPFTLVKTHLWLAYEDHKAMVFLLPISIVSDWKIIR